MEQQQAGEQDDENKDVEPMQILVKRYVWGFWFAGKSFGHFQWKRLSQRKFRNHQENNEWNQLLKELYNCGEKGCTAANTGHVFTYPTYQKVAILQPPTVTPSYPQLTTGSSGVSSHWFEGLEKDIYSPNLIFSNDEDKASSLPFSDHEKDPDSPLPTGDDEE